MQSPSQGAGDAPGDLAAKGWESALSHHSSCVTWTNPSSPWPQHRPLCSLSPGEMGRTAPASQFSSEPSGGAHGVPRPSDHSEQGLALLRRGCRGPQTPDEMQRWCFLTQATRPRRVHGRAGQTLGSDGRSSAASECQQRNGTLLPPFLAPRRSGRHRYLRPSRAFS